MKTQDLVHLIERAGFDRARVFTRGRMKEFLWLVGEKKAAHSAKYRWKRKIQDIVGDSKHPAVLSVEPLFEVQKYGYLQERHEWVRVVAVLDTRYLKQDLLGGLGGWHIDTESGLACGEVEESEDD